VKVFRPDGGVIPPAADSACLTVMNGTPPATRLEKGAISRNQPIGAASSDPGVGVLAGDPEHTRRSLQDRVGARRRPALVVAGFKRDNDGMNAVGEAGLASGADSGGLSMGRPATYMGPAS
jgi:hypothetical protein